MVGLVVSPPAGEVERLHAALEVLQPRVATLRFRARAAVRVPRPAASAWRGALGAQLQRQGIHDALALAWSDTGPPALWFRAWQGLDMERGEALSVELVVLEPARARWDALLLAFDGLPLGPSRLDLEDVAWLRVGLEPHLSDALHAVEVVALSPLQLRSRGDLVAGPPPMDVLVRSAGDRVRALDERWGGADPALPSEVGAAVRSARSVLDAAGPSVQGAAPRRSGRSGERHVVSGVLGTWLYPAVPSSLLPWLQAGAELGVGKGVALGAGRYRLRIGAAVG